MKNKMLRASVGLLGFLILLSGTSCSQRVVFLDGGTSVAGQDLTGLEALDRGDDVRVELLSGEILRGTWLGYNEDRILLRMAIPLPADEWIKLYRNPIVVKWRVEERVVPMNEVRSVRFEKMSTPRKAAAGLGITLIVLSHSILIGIAGGWIPLGPTPS